MLEQIKESRPLPVQIRVDNGPKLGLRQAGGVVRSHRVRLHHIQPGKPTQNAYIERFNRTFRTEVLNAHVFESLSQVRDLVHQWMIFYNEERPHDALGNLPPSLFSKQQTQNHNQPFPAPIL